MLVYTILEFEFTNYHCCNNGINIISQDNIKIINNDWSEFIEKYYNLRTVHFNETGPICFEHINKNNSYSVDDFNEYYYTVGTYKDIITKKYYILSFVELENAIETKCSYCEEIKNDLISCKDCKNNFCTSCHLDGDHFGRCNF